MKRLTTTILLTFPFFLACQSASKAPVTGPAASPGVSSSSSGSMRLEIQPAMAQAPAGWRVPLRFTIHNTGDQPVHACLSGARVVHLWELDSEHGYTLTQRRLEQPGCEEPFELPPHGVHSWTEEIPIPTIPASTGRIVGFTQVVQSEPCDHAGCDPIWLSASYSPFKIQEGAAQGAALDLRTGLSTTERTAAAAWATATRSGGER